MGIQSKAQYILDQSLLPMKSLNATRDQAVGATVSGTTTTTTTGTLPSLKDELTSIIHLILLEISPLLDLSCR